MAEVLDLVLHGESISVKVTYFVKVEPHKGSPHTCYSDWDYYGYTEIEWEMISGPHNYDVVFGSEIESILVDTLSRRK